MMGRQPASLQYQGRLSAARIGKAFRDVLACAAAYEGAAAPNPVVGCALRDGDGDVLARAAHQQAGGPHAEAPAIESCPKIKTSLQEVPVRLGGLGVHEVLVEAGPELLGAIVPAGLWDEHVIIGGAVGRDGGHGISICRRSPAGVLAG